jgi:hypothetical protein
MGVHQLEDIFRGSYVQICRLGYIVSEDEGRVQNDVRRDDVNRGMTVHGADFINVK